MSRATATAIRLATREDLRDADLAALVRSAAAPGLRERIAAYRDALRGSSGKAFTSEVPMSMPMYINRESVKGVVRRVIGKGAGFARGGCRGARVHRSDEALAGRFDVVVEATGSPEGLARAISLTRPRGTIVTL